MPFDPETASPCVYYLFLIVGPYPEEWDICPLTKQEDHEISLYTNTQPYSEARICDIGRWTRYCPVHFGCATQRLPKLPLDMCNMLLQDIRILKARPIGKSPTAHGRECYELAETLAAVINHDWPTAAADARARYVERPRRRRAKRARRAQPSAPTVPPPRRSEPRPVIQDDPPEVDEYDKYSALVYDTLNEPSRIITCVFYSQTRAEPLTRVFWVRFLSCFEISYFRVAEELSMDSNNFDRYCPFTSRFECENLQPINIRGRGSFMIYRRTGLEANDCPRLNYWTSKLQRSAEEDQGQENVLSLTRLKISLIILVGDVAGWENDWESIEDSSEGGSEDPDVSDHDSDVEVVATKFKKRSDNDDIEELDGPPPSSSQASASQPSSSQASSSQGKRKRR
ncbi:hypothetical protein R3P38DRAFT_2776844 [Favolaschia claudopus]|uniref:Uncharacterized protein n=1 Tax=Favolaschia claudopus TaxID=2862362 RepID=A0AAW0BMK6_9AGAR